MNDYEKEKRMCVSLRVNVSKASTEKKFKK